MNEEELKAMLGETAFKAMSKEQVTASLEKFGSSAKELANLKKEKEDRENQDKEKDKEKNSTLHDKVNRDRLDQDKKQSESKQIEAALTFTLSSADFLKQHEAILVKGASDIFKAADKEKYDSPIDKANAIKVGLIDLHFSQQYNVDFLNEDQKSDLADYQKLTKNGKEEKANEIYKNVFKPAIDIMKRVKKAEELGKSKQGLGGDTDADQALKDKMISLGQKKFFRGKN